MSALSQTSLFKKILAGSLIFYFFSGITSLLNYAFYPVIARFVSVSQYGEIQFLVSMFTQLAIGFIVLNILAIIISTRSSSAKEQQQAITSLNVVASLVTLAVVVIGSCILYVNQSALGFHDGTAIIALGISLVISVPFTVAIGRMQGNNRFIASGIINTLGALFKLIFSVLFVVMGLGVTGAILGIAVGMFATLIVVELADKSGHKHMPTLYAKGLKHRLIQLSYVKEQAAVAMLTLAAITLLSSADSIVSRIVLSPHAAGQYAAVATLAKIILAATSPLMWLALPPAISHDRKRIINLVSLAAIASGIACLIFSMFPDLLLKGLLGIDAGGLAGLLPLSSAAMVFCGLAFILISVNVCLGSLRAIVFSTVAAAACYSILLVSLAPTLGALQASLYGQLVGGVCLVIGGLLPLRLQHFDSSHQ